MVKARLENKMLVGIDVVYEKPSGNGIGSNWRKMTDYTVNRIAFLNFSLFRFFSASFKPSLYVQNKTFNLEAKEALFNGLQVLLKI